MIITVILIMIKPTILVREETDKVKKNKQMYQTEIKIWEVRYKLRYNNYYMKAKLILKLQFYP